MVAVIALIIICIVATLLSRRGQARRNADRSAIERAIAQKNLEDLKRKLSAEQSDASIRTALRHETLRMYDEYLQDQGELDPDNEGDLLQTEDSENIL